MQLQLKGPQDRYLQDSEFSHFTTHYKRPSRFALEQVEQVFPRGFVLGTRTVVDIPLAADALGGTSIELKLPVIPGAAAEDVWRPSIGYVLLRRIRIWLNETMIVDQERLWLDVADKLLETPGKRWARQSLVEGSNEPGTPLSLAQSHTILVPLRLPWSLNNFFPLVSMPGMQMSMELELESFENAMVLSSEARQEAPSGRVRSASYHSPTTIVVTFQASLSASTLTLEASNGTVVASAPVEAGATSVAVAISAPWVAVWAVCDGDRRRVVASRPVFPAATPELQAKVIFDMAFLERDERYTLLNTPITWTFQTQVDMEAKTYKESLGVDGSMHRIFLKTVKVDLSEINYPVRALVWLVYPENFGASGGYFSYVAQPFENCQLYLNNQELTLQRPGKHFELLAAYTAGTRCEAQGIFVHSFALDLPSPQFSGSVGFDKARQPFLIVNLTDSMAQERAVVKVFAIVRRSLILYKGRARFVTL